MVWKHEKPETNRKYIYRIATLPEEDQVMATRYMHKICWSSAVWFSSYASGQTNRRHTRHNTLHPLWGEVIICQTACSCNLWARPRLAVCWSERFLSAKSWDEVATKDRTRRPRRRSTCRTASCDSDRFDHLPALSPLSHSLQDPSTLSPAYRGSCRLWEGVDRAATWANRSE